MHNYHWEFVSHSEGQNGISKAENQLKADIDENENMRLICIDEWTGMLTQGVSTSPPTVWWGCLANFEHLGLEKKVTFWDY